MIYSRFYMLRCFIFVALILVYTLSNSIAMAKEPSTSFRILPTEKHQAHALLDWEGKKESEDDGFFGDSAPAQPNADPCKGDSIVGKINCDVADTMKKSGSGTAASNSQSSQSGSSTGAKPEASLDLKLIPNIQRTSGSKFKVTLIPDGGLVKKHEPSIEERLDLDNDEKKIIDAVKAWEKIYTKDELKALAQQKTITLDVAELFKDTKLLKLINQPILKLDVLPEPRLAALYLIGDQSGHAHLTDDIVSDEQEVNTNKFGSGQTRNMAVYMKDYDSTRDPEPSFTGPDGITYTVIATKGGIQDGRTDHKDNMNYLKPKAPAGPAGTELVLVRARIQPEIYPGFKVFQYQGQAHYWQFLYSDMGARVEVARQSPQGHWEPVSFALVGDKIRLQYHLTHKLKFDEIPLLFAEGDIKADEKTLKNALKDGKTFQLEKTDDAFIYATKPLFVMAEKSLTSRPPEADSAADSQKIILKATEMAGSELAYLVMGPDPDFTRDKLLAAYAPGNGFLKIPVRIAPPRDTLWKDALRRAAQCDPIKKILKQNNVTDWDQLPAQRKEKLSRVSVHSMAYSVMMWYATASNDIQLNPSADVSMGHHAAFMLMRDNALGVLKNMADRFEDISQDTTMAKNYYISLPNFRFPDNHILRLTKVRMPDGGQDNYAETMQDDTYLKEKYGLNDRELMDWRIDTTQQAAGQMAGYISKSAKHIRDANQCKTADLIDVLGDMYGVVGAMTKNSLVKSVTDTVAQRTYWVSDEPARHWIDSAIYLSKEVAARNREADIDTMALKAQLLAVTLVGATGSGAPLITDILGMGVTGFDMAGNIKKYMDVGRDRELARGKAAILGTAYYRRHEEKALTTQKFAVQMAMDIFGMAMDGYSAFTNLSRIWKARFFETPVKAKAGLTADEIWARIESDAERAVNPRLVDSLDAAPTRTWDEALNARPEWRAHLDEMRLRPSVLEGLNPDTVKALENIVPDLKGKKAFDAALFAKQKGLNSAETIVGKAWEANMSPAEIMAKTGMDMEDYTKALSGYLKKGQLVKDPDKIMKAVEDSFDPAKREALAASKKANDPAYAETGHYPAPVDVHAKTQPVVKPDVDVHAPTRPVPVDAGKAAAPEGLPTPHNNAAALKKALEDHGYKSLEDAGLTPENLRRMEEMSKGERVNYDSILNHTRLSKAVELDDTAMLAGHAFSSGHDPVSVMRKYNLTESQYKSALKDYLVKKEKLSAAKANDVIAKQMSPEKMKAAYDKQAEIDKIFGKKPDIRTEETFMKETADDIRDAETFMEESINNKAPSALDIKPGEAVVPVTPKAGLDEDGTAALIPAANSNAPASSYVVGPNSKIRGTDEAGGKADIELGDEIGDGYFNSVYEVKRAGKTPAVARVSKTAATDDAVKIDGFGREALKDADSNIVRAVERENIYVLDNGRQVEILEKIDLFAHQQIAKNPGGKMTNGQAIAFDKATRELNKKGYVWLDNHHKNYAFEKIEGTEDGWRVIVGDTGGVFKVKDIDAREMQKIISAPDKKFLESLEQFGPKSSIREALIQGRSQEVRERFKGNFDLEAMGIKSYEAVQFRSDGVVAYPKARELFNVEANPSAAYEALSD